MRLRHTTLRRNLPSIDKRGLLLSKCQGKLKAIWLHTPSKTAWAYLHTVRRHGGAVEDVVSVVVDVPDEWIRRSAVPGLFYVCNDIPPGLLLNVVAFQEVSESPIRGNQR